MKRFLIAPLLGSVLALGAVSLAAPDTSSTRTVIDSRLDTRLRAIDGGLFPDSFGSELRQMPDVGCEAPTTDQCFGSGV